MTTMIAKSESENKTTTHACACGCDTQIGRKSTFAPGHDAKMVSDVVRVVVHGGFANAPALRQEPSLNEGDGYAGMDIMERIKLAGNAIETHFGKPLAAKFDGAVHSAWEKAVGKGRKTTHAASQPTSTGSIDGEVRVGRWVYPAKRSADGTVSRYTRRQKAQDGDWVPADEKVASTFREV